MDAVLSFVDVRLAHARRIVFLDATLVTVVRAHDQEAVRHGIQDYLIKGQTTGRQTARAIRYAIERTRRW